jgi:hypothetical protein
MKIWYSSPAGILSSSLRKRRKSLHRWRNGFQLRRLILCWDIMTGQCAADDPLTGQRAKITAWKHFIQISVLASLLGSMEFCASCRLLDIRLQSFLSHPGADDNEHIREPIRCLGRLNEIRNRYNTCHLCRLVFAIFDSGPTKKTTGILEPTNITIFAKWMSPLGPGKAERLKSSVATILIWAVSPHIPVDTYKVFIRAVSRILPTQPHFGRISPTET